MTDPWAAKVAAAVMAAQRGTGGDGGFNDSNKNTVRTTTQAPTGVYHDYQQQQQHQHYLGGWNPQYHAAPPPPPIAAPPPPIVAAAAAAAPRRSSTSAVAASKVKHERHSRALSPGPSQDTTTTNDNNNKSTYNVWDHIERTKISEGRVQQVCKYCKKVKKSEQMQVTFWAGHLVDTRPGKGCPSCPDHIRHEVANRTTSSVVKEIAALCGFNVDFSNIKEGAKRSGSKSANDDNKQPKGGRGRKRAFIPSVETTTPAADSKRVKLEHYPTSTTTHSVAASRAMIKPACSVDQAYSITLHVARFIIACGLPLHLTDSPFFREMLAELNDDYTKRHYPHSEVFLTTWLPVVYDSIQKEMREMFNQETDCLCTLGCEHVGDDDDDDDEKGLSNESLSIQRVHILTQSMLHCVSFVACVHTTAPIATLPQPHEDFGSNDDAPTENEKAVVQMWIDRMVKATSTGDGGADDAEKKKTQVEDVFCAVVADKAKYSSKLGHILQQTYPKLFYNGCRLLAAERLRKDLCNIQPITDTIQDATTIATFITSHAPVKAVYERLVKDTSGELPTVCSHFAQADQMIESVVGKDGQNVTILQKLIHDEEWLTLLSDSAAKTGLDPSEVNAFVALVNNTDAFVRMNKLRQLTQPVCSFLQHLEKPNVRSSWLFPLFVAIQADVEAWCSDEVIQTSFPIANPETAEDSEDSDTATQVMEALDRFWNGPDGIQDSQHVFATILDPSTSPEFCKLPEDTMENCQNILKRFYKGHELLKAFNELNGICHHNGVFGRTLKEVRSLMEDAPMLEKADGTPFQVVKTIAEQNAMADYRPDFVWSLQLKSHYPRLTEISRRVLVMSTQAADVQRCCNAIKAVHAQNNEKLLYCHVNLRLLQHRKEQQQQQQNVDSQQQPQNE